MTAGHDAHEHPLAAHGQQRRPARWPEIWIRLGGAWHEGTVEWWATGISGWLAWIHHPGVNGLSGQPMGLYEYDPDTILRRLPDVPPGERRRTCSPAEAAAFQWRPQGTRRRDTPMPPAPCCGARVETAWVSWGALVCLPCGHSLQISEEAGDRTG